jgi:hypothetical protein
MGTLNEQYSQLLNDPASMQAMLGGSYQQSPGYQYQYDTAMNAGNSQLAAGGMLGTPGAQTQMMGTAQGLANQDYWNYYNANQNLYNSGLSGTQGMYNSGLEATNSLASGLGHMYGGQAKLASANMQTQNNMLGSLLGGLGGMFSGTGEDDEDEETDWLSTGLGAVGTGIGAYFGGPAGAAAGGSAGKAVGGAL